MYVKIYHQSYLNSLIGLDNCVAQFIRNKESLVMSTPLSWDRLKSNLCGYRKYKNKKIRILYALSDEHPSIWESEPQSPELMFSWGGLRDQRTYASAYKHLHKYGLA